jgi:hypothetical protein
MSAQMTDSPKKKSKDKRYRIDSDFFDDANTYVAPLTVDSDDEDAIDRLLLNTGFETDNAEELVNESDAFIEDRSFLEEFNVVSAEEDVLKPVKAREIDATAPFGFDSVLKEAIMLEPVVEEIIDMKESDFHTDSGFFAFDKEPEITPLGITREENIRVEDLTAQTEIHQEIDVSDPNFESATERFQNESTSNIDAAFSQLLFDLESINRQQERSIKNLEAKVKKSSTLAYVALGIAVAAIIAAAVAMSWYHKVNTAERVNASEGLSENYSINKNQSIDGGRSSYSDENRTKATSGMYYPKSGWFVNLISFKQRSDADSQAAEFMKKGVRAEIVEVEINKTVWYKLRVGGFINKEQAAAYADNIKTPLQLNSIWVTNN